MNKFSSLVLAGLTLIAAPPWVATARSAAPANAQCKAALTQEDIASIKAVIEKYRTSWLSGDVEGALNTFTDDGVVMPADAGDPLVGRDAMRKYWWPAGGVPTKIAKLDITYDEIGGDGQIAHVRGRDEVRWTMEENGVTKSHASFSTYLNVMKKLPDGSWRISHHMWDDNSKKRQ